MSIERPDLHGILKQAPLLAGLSAAEIDLLVARTTLRNCRSGEVLFQEGEPCKGLHIIASGKLRIFKTSVGGREQVLAIEGAGGSVAELPVFDGGTYPASASAVEGAEIAFISRKDFESFCLDHPRVALKLLAVVGGRLRRLVGIIEELSFTTIRQRLVAMLLRMAQKEGTSVATGIEILLPASHQELANQLGTVRELVSRNLTRLQAEGLIEVDARRIVIRDVKSLTALLNSSS